MPGLEVLSLAGNDISELEAEAFATLGALGLLSLVGNRLQHLEFKAVAGIRTAGTRLLLAHNPWTCDCDLQRAFGKLGHLRHLRVVDLGNLTCAGPERLSGAVLSGVEAQLCLAETATVLGITGAVLLTVAVAVLMAERKRRQGPEEAGELGSFLERLFNQQADQ
ncbi:PREDICTED: leucine-rich repeat-containing protein 3B-like [Mandrillus leucophaeus]|uniref:leucine-rich repeat-containing protein 3B-like n=1 Tax=Mandrillus leucophaeus TaxID=9568 RepID=UPI0005F4AB40|nr:PREDICTED: leucine-rich repeat-containing protein 3B-like [Mandrillus leucophaeus]